MKPWKRMLMEGNSIYSSDAIWVQIIRTTDSGGICRLGNTVAFHTSEGYNLYDLALYSNDEIDETENTVGVILKKFEEDIDSIDDSEIETLIVDGLEDRKEKNESTKTYEYGNYEDFTYGREWDTTEDWDSWDSYTDKQEKEIGYKFYGKANGNLIPFTKYLQILKKEGYDDDIKKIENRLNEIIDVDMLDDIEDRLYYYFQTPASNIMMGWLYKNKKYAGNNPKAYILEDPLDFIKIRGADKADMIISDSFNESTDKYFENDDVKDKKKEKEEIATEPSKKLYTMNEKVKVRNDITPGTEMKTITGFKDNAGKPTVTTVMFTSEHKEHASEIISINGYSITGLYISDSTPELLWAHSFLIPTNSDNKLQYRVSDIKNRLFTIMRDAIKSEPSYMAWGKMEKDKNIILSRHNITHPNLWQDIRKVYPMHNPSYRNVYGFNSYRFETDNNLYYIDIELYSGDDIESVLGENPLNMKELKEATEEINNSTIKSQENNTDMKFIESRPIDVKEYGYDKHDFVSGRLNLYESPNNK